MLCRDSRCLDIDGLGDGMGTWSSRPLLFCSSSSSRPLVLSSSRSLSRRCGSRLLWCRWWREMLFRILLQWSSMGSLRVVIRLRLRSARRTRCLGFVSRPANHRRILSSRRCCAWSWSCWFTRIAERLLLVARAVCLRCPRGTTYPRRLGPRSCTRGCRGS